MQTYSEKMILLYCRLNQPNKLFLDRWCSVIVNRTLNELTLELVDVGKQSITLPTSYAQLDADHQSLFLGKLDVLLSSVTVFSSIAHIYHALLCTLLFQFPDNVIVSSFDYSHKYM